MRKKNLLFLPGMMCDHRLYGDAARYFPASRYRFYYAAYRGESIEAMAKNILNDVPVPFFVIGLSMGGIVLMEILRQAPQSIQAAVLADTNHKAELPDRKAKRLKEIERVKNHGLKNFVAEEMKPKYFSRQLALQRKRAIAKQVLQMATDLGEKVFAAQSIALRERRDYEQTLAALAEAEKKTDKKKTGAEEESIEKATVKETTMGERLFFLCGEDDTLCPPAKHEEMQRLVAGSRLAMVEKAGHLSCMENADGFYKPVANFFADSPA